MKKLQSAFITLLLCCAYFTCWTQSKNDSPLASNAPQDKPFDVYSKQEKKFDSLIAPYVAQARKTLPEAKKRFLAGLKPGESFCLVTRVNDPDGKYEQIFVRVTEWNDDRIQGLISSELELVKNYHYKQLITFTEKDVYDWVFSEPDGSEDGNFVGKFLDTQ